MARRRSRSLAALIAFALVASACSPDAAASTNTVEPTTTSTAAPTTTSTTTSTTTTTTIPPTTTTTVPPTTTTTVVELPDIGVEIGVPDGDGPFPAIVLVHGGSWVAGDPSIMRPLASFLNDEGFMTINTPYQLALEQPGFPDAVDDVACAVRYAAAHPDSDGTVTLIGHSAGAHISAIVALKGDAYAEDCPVDGLGVPDRFVGLAGPYDIDRLGIVMLPFFGAGPEAEPEAWAAGNPHNLTDENTDLISLIMYGDRDVFVDDSFAVSFHNELKEAGSESLLELVEDARHNELRDPDWVGDLIVTWLER
ncbi:MAG: alpha/beta hydrolase [Actinomycetota bacterium]|nr:alpha/beta hydrolase [Actinomycetota bacterium]